MKTLINVVLDETGSMEPVKDKTIEGFNEYISGLKAQAKENGNDVRVTLTLFNSSRTHNPYTDLEVAEVPMLTADTYRPDDATPLYDAVWETIKGLEKRAGAGAAVLLIIMTDGQENASRHHTRSQVSMLIGDKKRAGWTIAYLGANQDSWAEGHKISVDRGSTRNYDYARPDVAFQGLKGATAHYLARSSAYTPDFFSAPAEGEDTPEVPRKRSPKEWTAKRLNS